MPVSRKNMKKSSKVSKSGKRSSKKIMKGSGDLFNELNRQRGQPDRTKIMKNKTIRPINSRWQNNIYSETSKTNISQSKKLRNELNRTRKDWEADLKKYELEKKVLEEKIKADKKILNDEKKMLDQMEKDKRKAQEEHTREQKKLEMINKEKISKKLMSEMPMSEMPIQSATKVTGNKTYMPEVSSTTTSYGNRRGLGNNSKLSNNTSGGPLSYSAQRYGNTEELSTSYYNKPLSYSERKGY